MSSELKPCPFCGAVGLDFSEGSTFRWLAYSCTGCGVGNETRVKTLGKGTTEERMAQAKQDAIDEWNRRKSSAASEQLPQAELSDDQLDEAWKTKMDIADEPWAPFRRQLQRTTIAADRNLRAQTKDKP